MPSGNIIGEVSVKVTPDTKGFAQELKAKLSKINDDFKVQVEMDTKSAQAQFKALKERIEKDDIHADVKLRVNRSELNRLSSSINQGIGNGLSGGGRGGVFSGLFRGILAGAKAAAKGVSQVVSGISGLIKAATAAGDAGATVAKSLSSMASGAASGAAGLAQMAVQLALIAALIAPIAGAIVILGGLAFAAVGGIVAGFAGLPIILTTILGGVGAVALGMDGIKNAARTLKPEFDALKLAVSNTFEKGLIPVFQQLKQIFPTLQEGLVGIAQKLVGAAQGIADVVTSGKGLENIQNAFSGIQTAMDQMGPGMKSLFTSLLNIAGTEILYRILGDTVGSLAQKFADFFEQLRVGGEGHAKLSDALIVMKGVLESLTDVLTAVGQAAMDFFVAAGPGITEFFRSLAEKISSMDWESLGQTFKDMFMRMAEAIERIPPETLNTLLDAIGGIATKVAEFADKGGFTAIINGLGILTYAIVGFMGWAQGLIDSFSSIIGWVVDLGVAFGVPGAKAVQMQLKVGGAFGQTKSEVEKSSSAMQQLLSGSTDQMGKDMSGLADTVGIEGLRAANDGKSAIADGARGMADNMRRGANDVGREAGTIPGKVRDATRGDLSGSGESLIKSFANGISRAGHWAIAAAGAVVGAVRRLFPFSPAKTGPFSGSGYTTHSGKALISDWALGMEKAAPAAVRTVENIASRVQAGMSGNLSGSISAEGYGDFTADMTAAMSGMAFTIDDRGGKVLARVVRRENNIQAVRRING